MPQLKLIVIPVTPFRQNCSLVYDEASKRGAVVDPGGDVPAILDAITKAGIVVEKILLTHGHIDHAGGAARLRDKLGVAIEGPNREDSYLLDTLPETGAQYGMLDALAVTPSRWLKHDDTVSVGDLTFSVIEAPGHSPGSIVYFNAENRFALMGDVLFQGSIGRTDFPRGDHQTLINSIRDKILPLGDDVSFLPGHGSPSTIGAERRTNPYLQG